MHLIAPVLLFIAGVYTFKDSLSRGRSFLSSLFWGLGVTFLFFLFFPLYLITRPKRKKSTFYKDNPEIIDITNQTFIKCPNCGQFYNGNPNCCPHCGSDLKHE